MKIKICIAELPHAGLGNKLFVWAQAYVFSVRNNCPLYVKKWSNFHVKAWLRGEWNYRNYSLYFKPHTLSEDITMLYSQTFGQKTLVSSKDFLKIMNHSKSTYYSLTEMPHWLDAFKGLKEYRAMIKTEFFQYLTPLVQKKAEKYDSPMIGVHIRMGDFRKLPENVDFKSVGGTRTPLEYFIHLITAIRQFVGNDLPAIIFSDGKDEELSAILNLPNVKRMPKDLDIVDLIVLSKSRILIQSAGSTFSQWATFLSPDDTIAIIHYDHAHTIVRDEATNKLAYEGIAQTNVENWDELLKQNLMKIATV
jgi:hypothetical protein